MTEVVGLTEEEAGRKWAELGPLIDRLSARINDKDDFVIQPRSPLAMDDEWSSPYQVSHAVKACIVAGVDHLHACKVLIVEAQKLHVAAPASLIRGCLENIATAYWILHPADRAVRVTRTLRWHATNARDRDQAIEPLGLDGYKPKDETRTKIAKVAGRHDRIDKGAALSHMYSTTAVKYADEHAPSASTILLTWRVCSGFAHGRQWANLAYSGREEFPTADPEVVGVRFTNDLARALYQVHPAMTLVQDLLRLHDQRSRPLY